MSNNIHCPMCDSTDVRLRPKRKKYMCEDCDHQFVIKDEFQPLRIFISYGHDEYAVVAEQLKEDLLKLGHEVWFDLNQLKEGQDWEAYIEKGINWATEEPNYGRMILLMTPYSVRRPNGYCLNEITYALSKGLPIIPIMVVWTEAPLSICRIQYLDMQDCYPINDNYDLKFKQLANNIQNNALDVEGIQATIMKSLEPIPFEAEFIKNLKNFTGRQWLINQIDEWLDKNGDSRIFLLTGSPGTGKTAIASWLCQYRAEIAAFHLCQFGNQQKNNPIRAIKSIAYQLGTQLQEYNDKLKKLNFEQVTAELNAQTLFDMLIIQPLSSITPPIRPVLILIDALDEATKDGKNIIASLLPTEFHKTPAWLRLIITSRPDPEVMYPLQGLQPYQLDTTSDNNEADMREYIRTYFIEPDNGIHVTPAMVKKIIQKSEGVFLYLYWIKTEIETGRLSLNNIDQLPGGLGGVYAHLFERQFPSLEEYRRSIRPLLEVIVATQEPLKLDKLTYIFEWDEYEFKEIKEALGSLFKFNNEEVTAFHTSLIDWLTDSFKSGPYFVSENSGHNRLANIGWIQYEKGVSHMSDYMVSYLPLHLKKAGLNEQYETILMDLSFWELKIQKDGFFGGYNFSLRYDGLKALEKYYNLSFTKMKKNEKDGSHQVVINYEAIENGIVPVGMGFATDGGDRSEDIISLIDDKELFDKFHPAPIVRKEVFDRCPEIENIMNSLSDLLTFDNIINLNRKVDIDKEDPLVVARNFLRYAGLIDNNTEQNEKDYTIIIGSKLYTEQFILSGLTIELLRYHGYNVIDKRGVGNFIKTREAIESGDIDMYWDYVSTAFANHLRYEDLYTPLDQAFNLIKKEDEDKGLIWFNFAPYNNCFTLNMKRHVAEAMGIETISDLSRKFKEAKRLNQKKEKAANGLPILTQ